MDRLSPGMYLIEHVASERSNARWYRSQMWLVTDGDSDPYKLVFSARPDFGTQDLPRHLIKSLKKVPDDSVVYVSLRSGKPIPRHAHRSQHYDPTLTRRKKIGPRPGTPIMVTDLRGVPFDLAPGKYDVTVSDDSGWRDDGKYHIVLDFDGGHDPDRITAFTIDVGEKR